jgi:RHS repeat-associated protein
MGRVCRQAAVGALVCSVLCGEARFCAAVDKSGVQPNTISLPSGPGSIEGLGESFEPMLNTGTAKYAVSLKVPPGTSGHEPKLSLRYEGGSGNGPLGFGWQLDLAYIQRQTDKGIPRYIDTANGIDDDGDGVTDEPDELDVFVTESGEELVPMTDGSFFAKNEGAFVRYRQVPGTCSVSTAQQCTAVTDCPATETCSGLGWEATLPDGTRLAFGTSAQARISDPATGHVFRWLVERATDPNGNAILYTYRSFDGSNDPAPEHNLNQKYCAKIEYGPGAPTSGVPWSNFHFVAFTYEPRSDWFEDARAGFLCRTGMRLREIAVGTQGPTLDGHAIGDFNTDGIADSLDRKYELVYAADAHWSLLTSVTEVGADGVSTLPPLTLGYTEATLPDTLSASGQIIGSLDEPPQASAVGASADLVDLNGDGLPDILKTEPFGGPHTAFLNLGEETDAGTGSRAIRWAGGVELGGDPLAANFNLGATMGNVAHLADMDGDGLSDFAYKSVAGDTYYFRNRGDVSWDNRVLMNLDPTDSAPPSPFESPDVKTADLNFDKRMDIIQSVAVGDGAAYRIWINLGGGRYARSVTVSQDSGFLFSDPNVQIADFNGDRVPDIARVHPTGVDVTAGLGYGNFAAPVTVTLPDYTLSDDQVSRAKLEDVTGDGLVDLVLERATSGELWYWVNLGNYQFDKRRTITGMPTPEGTQPEIRWADLNGNGTTDLAYLDSASNPIIRTVDIGRLIGCVPKPHLLTSVDNGLGVHTAIEYRTSTELLVQARRQGSPWSTVTPFPVSVVIRSIVTPGLELDGKPGQDQYVTDYVYRDAYYDGYEKDFRGFAFVNVIKEGDESEPSLVTRNHFHTGAPDHVDNDGDGKTDERTLLGGAEEESLKGKLLETEQETCAGTCAGDPQTSCTSDTDCAVGDSCNCSGTGAVFTREYHRWEVRTLYTPQTPSMVCADNQFLSCAMDTDCTMAGFVGPCVLEDGPREGLLSQPYTDPSCVQDSATSYTESGVLETAVPGKAIHWAVETGKRSAILEGGPEGARKDLLTEINYDGYGNTVWHKDWGVVSTASLPPFGCVLSPAGDCTGAAFSFTNPTAQDQPADEKFVCRRFARNLTQWQLRSESVIEEHDGGGNLESRTRSYYDGPDFIGLSLGQVMTGNLMRKEQWLNSESRDISRVKKKFDRYGNVVEIRDARDDRRTVMYDVGFQTYATEERVYLDGYSLNMSAAYDEGFGVVKSSTSWAIDSGTGPLARYGYDTFGRPTATAQPGDSLSLPTDVYEYHLNEAKDGLSWIVIRKREVSGVGANDGQGTVDSYQYVDGLGRKLGTKEEGDNSRWIYSGATAFNRRGTESRRWLPYSTASNSYQPPDPAMAFRINSYDATGRRTVTDNPDNSTSKMNYNPLSTDTYDENDTAGISAGAYVTQSTDGLGRLVQVLERNMQACAPGYCGTYQTSYSYDARGNLTSIIDAQGNEKLMSYDSLNRRISMNDPDRGRIAWTYDDTDNILSREDAKGQSTLYTYDRVNRRLTEDYMDANGHTPDVRYVYDTPVSNLPMGDGTTESATFTEGYLASVYDLSGEEHTSYDARRRVKWEVKNIRDPSFPNTMVPYATRQEYDSMDRPVRLVYPDGDSIVYQYGSRGLVRQIEGGQGGTTLISDVSYRPSGQIEQVFYGNGIVTTHKYDIRNRLTQLRTQNSGLTIDLLYYAYTLDPASNITDIEDLRSHDPADTAPRNSQSFMYDDLHRMTEYMLTDGPTPGAKIDYTYDRIGNVLTQASGIVDDESGRSVTNLGAMTYGGTRGTSNRSGRSASDPPGPHALTHTDNGVDVRSYQYDANGNMTSIDGVGTTWDFKDRLIGVQTTDNQDAYVYDYADRRISKQMISQSSTVKSTVVYVNRFFELRDNRPMKYVFMGDTRVARVEGVLSASGPLVQRIRLTTGWNQATLAVTAADAAAQLGVGVVGSSVTEAYRWRNVPGGYEPIYSGTALAVDDVLWLRCDSATTLTVRGDYAPPSSVHIAPGGSYVGLPWLQSVPLSLVPDAAAVWQYDPLLGSQGGGWRLRPPAGLAARLGSELPPLLSSGGALYVMAPAAFDVAPSQPMLRFYHQDHIGSSDVLTDGAGNLVERNAFYPYGEPRYHSDDSNPGSMAEPYLFTQKERDAETGLQYFEARFLLGTEGRFTSVDAVAETPADVIKEPQRLNPYSYALNSPKVFIDPDGKCASNPDGTINCVGPAWQLQKAVMSETNMAFSEGRYGAAAVGLLLATANTVNVAVGVAAETIIAAPYNAGYNIGAGIRDGDSSRLVRGGVQAAMIFAPAALFKGAQFLGSAAIPKVSPGDVAFTRYMEAVEQLNVSTPKNAAVFWSGPGNRAAAEAFAKANGRMTLEMTTGGAWLDAQQLFGANSPLTPQQAAAVWGRLSERFAEGASGNAVGFVAGSRAASLFNTVESPTLSNNPNVTNLITGGQ